MVTLQNVTRRTLVLNLAHDSLKSHEKHGYKAVTRVVGAVHPETGNVTPMRKQLMLPSSLTMQPGERVANLPNGVLECPEVKAHLKPRDPRVAASLRLVSKTDDQPAAPAAPAK